MAYIKLLLTAPALRTTPPRRGDHPVGFAATPPRRGMWASGMIGYGG